MAAFSIPPGKNWVTWVDKPYSLAKLQKTWYKKPTHLIDLYEVYPLVISDDRQSNKFVVIIFVVENIQLSVKKQ